MSRKQSSGVLKLYYVPSIASLAAPTATEINAGTNLTSFLRKNGLKRPRQTAAVDASDMSSNHNAQGRGSSGGQPLEMTFYRDGTSGSDTAWTTLAEGTTGYIVVAPFGMTPTSGDRVEVWPIEAAVPDPIDVADNEYQQFKSTCFVTAKPNLTAAVA